MKETSCQAAYYTSYVVTIGVASYTLNFILVFKRFTASIFIVNFVDSSSRLLDIWCDSPFGWPLKKWMISVIQYLQGSASVGE